MSLELSPEIEKMVCERAEAEGLSVNELLSRTFGQEGSHGAATTDPMTQVRALLAQWQAQDHTLILPPIPTRNGETPTQALFRRWEEEDASMTDEERAKQELFWEEYQQSINANRAKAGMRKLF